MAFNDDEKPHTSNTGSTRGLVTIKRAKYFKDDAALTADTVTVEVEINATSSTIVREGLDLVAVLDLSGRMDGEKIDSMKKAMVFVIMKLTPVDRLSMVTFSDGATRISPLRSMTPAAQNDLRALVDGLQASGGTNIQAGLETGLAVLADRVNTKARTANIFLMSDGHQTSGDARQVDPGQVAIYTFGFGRDTDHQLMSDIAKKSHGGTFSSVPDGSKVSLPFSQLLAGLLTVVAQNVELRITPKTEEGDDVDTIAVAPSAEYTQTTDATTGVITIKFGTLFAGEGRRVVITLTLKDVSSKCSEEYDALLADAQHSFSAQGKPRDPQIPQDIQIKRTPTPSQAPGASSKARQVQAEIVVRRQHVEVIRQAGVLADGKDLNKAPEGIMVDDVQKPVDSLRAELLQLITLMDTQQLYEAKGRLYALASERSHSRQRYAARGGGDDDCVRLFATPRMEAYREQAKELREGCVKQPAVPSAADEVVNQENIDNPLTLSNAIEALALQAPGASSKARQMQAEIARRQHAEAIRQARLLADGGQLDEARYKLVDAQKASENIVLDGGEKLVNSLRAELQQLMKLMETEETYIAKGRPYALASETSHGRQRYAARGGDEDDDVRLFATPRMDTPELYKTKGRPYVLASETSHGRQRYSARGGYEDCDVRLFTTPRMDTYLEQAKDFEDLPVPSAADEDVKRE